MSSTYIYTDGACSGNPGPGGRAYILYHDELEPNYRYIDDHISEITRQITIYGQFDIQGVRLCGGYQPNSTNNQMELLAMIRSLEHTLHISPVDTDILQHTNIGLLGGSDNIDSYISKYISGKYIHKDPINIYTDSRYVIDGLTRYISSWIARDWITTARTPVANIGYWKYLYALTQLCISLELHRVRGHSSSIPNHIVDRLAVSFSKLK